MKAVTVQFDQAGDRYERLLDVFVNSWKKNSKIALEIHRIEPPATGSRNKGFYYNHRKLKQWIASVDGDTIFVDCDMLLMEDISCGFDSVKHIGITGRRPPFPYNGGVVFVRDNEKSRKFLNKWLEIDGQMLRSTEFHMPYRMKYAGLNQSSLGWMLENGYRDFTHVLPEAYNLCDGWPDWRQAKMIHVKGRLRDHVLRVREDRSDAVQQISKAWHSFSP